MYLSNLGGYSAVLWMFIALIVGPHQQFKFEQALGARLFTTDQRIRSDEMKQEDDVEEVRDSVLNRVQPKLKFGDYVLMQFSGCCGNRFVSERKKRKFEAHTNTMERLSSELDIEQLISHMRISKFIARVYLRKN